MKKNISRILCSVMSGAMLTAMTFNRPIQLQKNSVCAETEKYTYVVSVRTEAEAWDGSIAEGFEGSGTETEPYIISNGAELALLASRVNSGETFSGMYFSMTNDIYLNGDLGDCEHWNDEDGTPPTNSWTPIGQYIEEEYAFSGNFDGNDHGIYGLFISPGYEGSAGLFGITYNASISNVKLYSSNLSGGNFVGGIVGECNYSLVQNCENHSFICGTGYVGGIVGRFYSDSEETVTGLENCKNYGTVTANYYFGGIVGEYGFAGALRCCENYGAVTELYEGESFAMGGIVGKGDGVIDGCKNYSAISSMATQVGGIVGNYYSADEASIRNCVNESGAAISGQSGVGGIVGDCSYAVTNCRNYAEISASDRCAGGIAGIAQDSIIELSANFGNVHVGNEYAGGICGTIDMMQRVAFSFNHGNISGTSCIGGLIGAVNGSGEGTESGEVLYDCYSIGNVEGSSNIGGAVGRCDHGEYARLYTAGTVSCTVQNGNALLGCLNGVSPSAISNCFTLDTAYRETNGTALTAEQMTEAASYTGFDFDAVWFIDSTAAYTYPQLTNNPNDTPTQFIPGDVDGNGEVSIADALMILRHAMGVEELSSESLPAADLDGDGQISGRDALLVLRLAIEG